MHTNEWIEEEGLRNTRRRKVGIFLNPTVHFQPHNPSILRHSQLATIAKSAQASV
jgi:hypothetical protein